MTGKTLHTLLEWQAAAAPRKPALICAGEVATYGQFYDHVIKLAERLRITAKRPGAVGISSRDGLTALTAFFACAAIGRPAMPLDPEISERTLEVLLENHPIAALVGNADDISTVSEPLPANEAGSPSFGPAVDGNAEFYWGLTSGTTGGPKLFARSHASWIASFEAAEAVFPFSEGSQILVPGPLHNSLFLYGAIHALCRGHTVILPTGRFRPDRLADAMGAATHLYVVPFMLSELLKADFTAPQLRMIFSGGAKLSDELRNECERIWPAIDLVEFYGASETSFISYHSTSAPASPGSVGRPFPSVAIEIRNESGQAVPRGRNGEVFISSPMLFARYVGEEPAGEWFSAGDTGFVDPEACLHLNGRTNRVIKSRGMKIHPEPIEEALAMLPEVRRAAVVDLPDALRGAVPAAAIEFNEGRSLARNRLSAHCREQLGEKFCPKRFFITAALPLTRSGKIAVAELRDALLSDQPSYRELK